jgi:hypothetical protein
VIIAALVIFFTRASTLRTVGALIGVVLFVALNIVWDLAASAAGWWHYPNNITIQPVWVYTAQALVWGTIGTLIGWRIARRFGMRGLTVFFVILSAIGAGRDFAYSVKSDVLVFTMPFGLLMDSLAWASLYVLSYLTMRLIAGPASDDRLARSHKQS